MSKPQPPEPPDPQETSAASTGTNVSTAIANNMMGMIDQKTPEGSITYTQEKPFWWRDPFTDTLYKVPTFSAETKLTPEGQVLHDANMDARTNLAKTAEQQSGFLRDYLDQGMSTDGLPKRSKLQARLSDELMGGLRAGDFANSREETQAALMDRMRPEMDRDLSALETRLANQGIGYGTEAYDAAMATHQKGVNDARLAAIAAAGDEQRKYADMITRAGAAEDAGQALALEQRFAARNQPINEITALLSGSQVQAPKFGVYNPGNIPITDNAQIINDIYKGELNAYGTQMQGYTSLMGGLFGLMGSAISDIRLKTDVEKVGEVDNLGVYSFRYVWDDPSIARVGYIAQEVLAKKPDAVVEVGDYLAVDYTKVEDVR